MAGNVQQKFDAALLQVSNRFYDIICRHRDMLHTFAVVEVEVLFHLRLLLTLGRFVDGKLNKPVSIRHYLAH